MVKKTRAKAASLPGRSSRQATTIQLKKVKAKRDAGRLAYAVSLVTQGDNRFYTLTMFSSVLKRTCFVTRRVEDPIEGFQRTLDKKRAQDIAAYIDAGGSIANSIVLSAQPEAGLKVIGKGKTLEFNDTGRAFLILDGQHRVYGFALSNKELRVPVVIYNGLTRVEEAQLFIDINTNQKPVPNALLLDIRKLAESQDEDEAFLSSLFDQFNENVNSPLIGLLSPAEQVTGKISRVTFNAAIKSAVRMFEDFTVDETYRILRPYLKVWYDGLAETTVSEAMTKSVVFRSILGLFPVVVQRVQDRHGIRYTEETFSDVLTGSYFKSIRSKMKSDCGNSVKLFQEKLAKSFIRPVSLR